MINKPIVISIIGFGATGLSLFSQLIEKLQFLTKKHSYLIRIFEQNKNFGLGVAYAVKNDSFLLNSPAGLFSIYPNNNSHFYDWLIHNPEKWKPYFPHIKFISKSSFLPRRLAGIYLKDCFVETKKKCEKIKNIECEFINKKVKDIILEKNNLRIVSNLKTYSSSFTIICTGSKHETYDKKLLSTPGYIDNLPKIENTLTLNKFKNSQSILIIGTRLSAIDAVTYLVDKGYRGKIYLSSREGVIPAIRSETKFYKMKFLNKAFFKTLTKNRSTPLTIQDFLSLIQNELISIYKKEISKEDIIKTPANTLKNLQYNYNIIQKEKALWQKSMVGVILVADLYWNQFSLKEKQVFVQKYIRIMQRYISSFPIENAKKLLNLYSHHLLEVYPNLSSIKFNKERNKYEATFQNSDEVLESDAVINAIGYKKNLCNDLTTFIGYLSQKGIIKKNPFEGVDVYLSSFRLKGLPKNIYIYAAGSITFGSVLITDTLYTCAKQSKIITNHITKTINSCLTERN